MEMLSDAEVAHYRREGYLVIRDVLASDEVERLRAACERHGAGSVLGRSPFTELLLDERIIGPLKQLLGPRILHFGEASARYDDKVVDSHSRHFHNDSRADDFDFSKPYPVVRVAFYLQDHARRSGGLKLRPRSFERLCRERMGWRRVIRASRRARDPRLLFMGRSTNVASRAGDVVVWNLRLHHSGYAVRLRGLPNLSLLPGIENRVPRWLQIEPDRLRCVIFATFAAPSDYFESFLRDRVERENMVDFWAQSDFDQPYVHELARKAGVTLRLDGLEFSRRARG
jgi:hypothetical protein